MQLIQYWLDTGHIQACYETEVPRLLAAQIMPDDPIYGYLELAQPLGITDQERYEVLDGTLHPKQEIRLTATPSSFAADGTTACQITLSPFVPCILVINGHELVLTVRDATVLLTADSPMVFHVTLKRMPSYWAMPLRVEAH